MRNIDFFANTLFLSRYSTLAAMRGVDVCCVDGRRNESLLQRFDGDDGFNGTGASQ